MIDPQPTRRHKRFTQGVLVRLEALTRGTPEEVLLQAALTRGAAPVREVVLQSHLTADAAQEGLAQLLASGALIPLENGPLTPQADTHLAPASTWHTLFRQIVDEVETYHATFPLRAGMPKEELRSRLKIPPRLFTLALQKTVAEGALLEAGPSVARPGHQIRFTLSQEKGVARLLGRFDADPYAPPAVKECQAEVGEPVYNALVELGQLVPVSSEVVFRKDIYHGMVAQVSDLLAKEGTITVAEFRDRYKTSRRYALAFLEHLDKRGITIREGDVRRLK